MKSNQKHTPKYWIGYSKVSDDVYIETANKCREDSSAKMDEKFGYSWVDDPNLGISLFSIDFAEGFPTYCEGPDYEDGPEFKGWLKRVGLT